MSSKEVKGHDDVQSWGSRFQLASVNQEPLMKRCLCCTHNLLAHYVVISSGHHRLRSKGRTKISETCQGARIILWEVREPSVSFELILLHDRSATRNGKTVNVGKLKAYV